MTNGFQISNIDFRQEGFSLPAGIYTYSLEVIPTTSTLKFGYKLKNNQSIIEKTIIDLTANIRQFTMLTFEIGAEDVLEVFYPARQLGAKIFKVCLNKGSIPIDVSANPSDSDEYTEARIKVEANRITSEVLGETASLIEQTTDRITSEVLGETASLIEQTTNGIKLEVRNDLESTGIYIDQKEIKVSANKFSVLKPDGTPLAVFDENINIDNDGNMKLNSLRVPFSVITPNWTSVSGTFRHVVDWDVNNNVVITGVPLNRNGSLFLPGGKENDGRQITIVYDPYWRSNIAQTHIIDLKPTENGRFYLEGYNDAGTIRLYSQCRHILELRGVWNATTLSLDWAVLSDIDFSGKKTILKAGSLLVSGLIDSFGNAEIIQNNYNGSWNISKNSSNEYVIKPNQIIRYNSAFNTQSWAVNTYNDLILNVNSAYLTRIYRTFDEGFRIANYLPNNASIQTAYMSFEIRTMRDINQRHY